MKLVFQHPFYPDCIVIEQRTEYSKYVLSYSNVLYDEETCKCEDNDVMCKFETIDELIYFIENVEPQQQYIIDEVKKKFNIKCDDFNIE